jgi:hypothetical protein
LRAGEPRDQGKPNVNNALPAAIATYCLPSSANDIGALLI